MTQVNQVYKCEICGNIVEVLHAGSGELVCCGEPMILQVENTVDTSKEKHVPIFEKIEGGVIVKIGAVEHPMVDAHYIEWIEVITKNKIYRKYLMPGDAPQAEFLLSEDILQAREYCNVHGLWKTL